MLPTHHCCLCTLLKTVSFIWRSTHWAAAYVELFHANLCDALHVFTPDTGRAMCLRFCGVYLQYTYTCRL